MPIEVLTDTSCCTDFIFRVPFEAYDNGNSKLSVYVLYCEEDRDNNDIDKLKKLLIQRFVRVKDHTTIPFGPNQIENARKLIEKAKTVVCIVTKHFLNDDFSINQLKFAKETCKKAIFPIFLDNIRVDPNSQLYGLLGGSEYKAYNAFQKKQFDLTGNVWKGNEFDQLISSINSKV